MALLRLPYQRVGRTWQPIVPIGVNLTTGWQRLDVYVDSGATYSVLKAKIADRLGFDYRQGNRISLQVGDGSLIVVYLHNLEVQLGTERFICPMGFSAQFGVPFNVLGKTGIFDRFKICFQQRERTITFESGE